MVSLLFKFSSLFAEQVRAVESEARLSNSLRSDLPITDENCKILFDNKVNRIRLMISFFCMVCIFRSNSLLAEVQSFQISGLTLLETNSLILLCKEHLTEISLSVPLGLTSKWCLFTISASLSDIGFP